MYTQPLEMIVCSPWRRCLEAHAPYRSGTQEVREELSVAQNNLGRSRWIIWAIIGIFALFTVFLIVGGIVVAIKGGGNQILNEQRSHSKASKAYVDLRAV